MAPRFHRPAPGCIALIPPPEGHCPECAEQHDPENFHNAQSIFYQAKFQLEHERMPTWEDAMSHCAADHKDKLKKALTDAGVDWQAGDLHPKTKP